VLLVEDEADIRGFVAEALRERGCRVFAEPDGPTGLNALRALLAGEGVDMLVADVGLPGGLNGRQLADAARALSPDLPVLLITGYPGPAAEPGATLPPGMQILNKPFELQSLMDRLDLCLNRVPEGRRMIDTPPP
jgi:DNA-binding response OmpR family regulator